MRQQLLQKRRDLRAIRRQLLQMPLFDGMDGQLLRDVVERRSDDGGAGDVDGGAGCLHRMQHRRNAVLRLDQRDDFMQL